MTDFGAITLLEVCDLARGSRVAYCLPRGEFLFTTPDAACFFRVSSARDLFGKNICDYIVLSDLEKLQDYIRTHSRNGLLSNEVSSKLTLTARLVGVNQKVWIRFKTTPVSLRLLRCIDSVTVLALLSNHFSDSSSFVVGDDELSAIFKPECAPQLEKDCDEAANTSVCIAAPASYEVPVELKTGSHCPWEEGLMSTSPSSPTGLLGSMDESLSDIAFLADWASESSSSPSKTPRV